MSDNLITHFAYVFANSRFIVSFYEAYKSHIFNGVDTSLHINDLESYSPFVKYGVALYNGRTNQFIMIFFSLRISLLLLQNQIKYRFMI